MNIKKTPSSPNETAASPETVGLVRQQVRGLLESSPAFRDLPRDRQVALAHDLVNIGSYLAEPEGIRASTLPGGVGPSGSGNRQDADALAFAQAERGIGRGQTGPRDPSRFEAQAAQEGARAAGALMREVNFPEFVAGLINGVFHSIVTTSLEQMEAYAKLVADVAKTLNQFRDENVSVNQGRDYLVDTYPDSFFLDMDSGEDGQPRVRLRDGVDERQALSQVGALPVEGAPLTGLDDETIEERLVPAARTQLATSRQQLLATLVLMGINRVVVTDGRIAARVMFDFQARDNFRYAMSATKFDYDKNLRRTVTEGEHETDYRGGERQSSWSKEEGWQDQRRDASYYAQGKYKHTSEPILKLAQVETSATDAQLTSKAQLMGNVEVNFKSDYLPLEKMADSFQIAQIQEAARPGELRQTGAGGQRPSPTGPAATPAA
jgi:hypothetical protein